MDRAVQIAAMLIALPFAAVAYLIAFVGQSVVAAFKTGRDDAPH